MKYIPALIFVTICCAIGYFVYVIFFNYSFVNNGNGEILYFKYTIIGVILSALITSINIYIVIHFSLSSSILYKQFNNIFKKIENSQKSAEFSNSIIFVSNMLDGCIDRAIEIRSIEDNECNNITKFTEYVDRTSGESLLVYIRVAARYVRTYENFRSNFDSDEYYKIYIESLPYTETYMTMKRILNSHKN